VSGVYGRELEECLVEFLRIVRGSGREPLSQLAADLGLIARWQRRYQSWSVTRRKEAVTRLALVPRRLSGKVLHAALLDNDETVQLQTARAMISNFEPGELVHVFGLAISGSTVTRMVLAEELRPHALELAKDVIPDALTCGISGPILNTLEVLRAWGKFLPLGEVYPLLCHQNAAIRTAAFQLLPLIPRSPSLESEILNGLNDSEEGVQLAAAAAAARLTIKSALPCLARWLHESEPGMTSAAAYALAQLGPLGCEVLERETFVGSPVAASIALEALESVRTSQTEMVMA
jgi:HEAT repeat protein